MAMVRTTLSPIAAFDLEHDNAAVARRHLERFE